MEEPMFDFHLYLQKIEFLAPKINHGIHFIFLIDGRIIVETDSRYYKLEKNDILVLNRNQLYEIRGTGENSVLMLTISDQFMERYYPEYRNHRFKCYSREVDLGRVPMIDKIRKMLGEITIAYLRKEESYGIEIQGLICQILMILIRRFKQEGTVFQRIDTEDHRLTQIIDYLEKNYDQLITLEDMAKKTYLSTGYLSRYFKQKTGVGFSRFLMNIRLKHSIKNLLHTSESIEQIALRNGFPNTKSFTSLFKEVYGVTPNIYRKNHGKVTMDSVHTIVLDDKAEEINTFDVLSKLGMLLTKQDRSYSNTETRFEELFLDLTNPSIRKLIHPDHILIVGELKELLKEGVRSEVLMVKDEIQLHSIGIRHLLSGTTILPAIETDEMIPSISPYFNSDIVLNFMKNHGLSLFVRIDYKEITINEEGNFRKLERFLLHCLQAYGESYLSSWRFMYYEPYYTGSKPEELQRVYIKLYQLLKQYVPDIKVGTFLPFSFSEEKVKEEHAWQLKEEPRIDFFGYNANQNEVIDFTDMSDDRFLLAKDYIKEKTNKIKAYLKHHHSEKSLYLVTWNTLSGNTRFTNGTFFRGALVLKNVLDVANDVTSIGFWINTELHEEDDSNLRIRMEGLELFHYFSGKRPAFFAMLFAARLEGSILAQGSDYIVTKNPQGYQLVLMNCTNVNPYFSIEETFLQKLNKDIHVTITGIPKGEYQIRKYVFDQDNGALYKNLWKLNSKHGMDQEMIDYIIRSSHPKLEIFDEMIEGDWNFYSYLSVNAIHYFEIRTAFNQE